MSRRASTGASAAAACSPRSVSGMSVRPVWRPDRLHSVSPCRSTISSPMADHHGLAGGARHGPAHTDVTYSSPRGHGSAPPSGRRITDGVSVRIAYVTESFPPDVNGVAHTAVRLAEYLVSRGHQPLVIAPEPARGRAVPDAAFDFPVVRVPSAAVPVYPGLRVGLPGARVRDALAAPRADLIHLAGPFVLGAAAAAAGRRLRLP